MKKLFLFAVALMACFNSYSQGDLGDHPQEGDPDGEPMMPYVNCAQTKCMRVSYYGECPIDICSKVNIDCTQPVARPDTPPLCAHIEGAVQPDGHYVDFCYYECTCPPRLHPDQISEYVCSCNAIFTIRVSNATYTYPVVFGAPQQNIPIIADGCGNRFSVIFTYDTYGQLLCNIYQMP